MQINGTFFPKENFLIIESPKTLFTKDYWFRRKIIDYRISKNTLL